MLRLVDPVISQLETPSIFSGLTIQSGRYAPDGEAIRARARDARCAMLAKSKTRKGNHGCRARWTFALLDEDWEDGSVYTGMYASLPRNRITLIGTRNWLGKHGIPYLRMYGGRWR